MSGEEQENPQSEYHLSRVDMQAIENFYARPNFLNNLNSDPTLYDLTELQGLVETYPFIKGVALQRANTVKELHQPRLTLTRRATLMNRLNEFDGMFTVFYLLNDSRSRTGGIIPTEVRENLSHSLAASYEEKGVDFSREQREIFNSDPILYFALTTIALKRFTEVFSAANPLPFLDGAKFALDYLNNALESKRLSDQFPQ